MAAEIRDAAELFAGNPFAHARRASRPFFAGLEYRFLLRDGITVRLNFVFQPGRNAIRLKDLLLVR